MSNPKNKDEFYSLVRIIIGQQLSGLAARTIFSRVENILGKKNITPIKIISTSHKQLRECGISNAKINYIKNLSKILLDQPDYFKKIKQKRENEIIRDLCKLKGVGIWTASIFAMGTIGYENIFPYGDTSIKKAIKHLYGKNYTAEQIIANWSPYTSFGCRVLWQWIDKGMPNNQLKSSKLR